jgi:flagellar basal-body rod protein FlgC
MFNTPIHSSLEKALYIVASGIKAQDDRMLVIAQNIANAHVRPTEAGANPYQRKIIKFSTYYDQDLQTERLGASTISSDLSAFRKVFDPSDPAADKKGYVLEANVNPIIEMSDMREANRAHEANVRVFERTLSMMQNVSSLLKG